MPSTPTDIFQWVQAGGIAALLFLALVGYFRGWWVTGREMAKEVKRADKFEEFYDQATVMLKSSLDKADEANKNLRDQVDLLSKLVSTKERP